MKCPKCKKEINDNLAVCPECHKVILLECPNCHSLSETTTCETCGYTILVKCSKCSKIVPYAKTLCSKCGFPTSTSLAYQECEADDFASIIINFGALKKIRRSLKSGELYSKFIYKLKNILYSQLKCVECKFITYEDIYVVNFNKELSFTTSASKAVRFAIKLINAYVNLNLNLLDNFVTPLDLTITIVKKRAEELQELNLFENNIKTLTLKKNMQKYLRGFQLILDESVRDEIAKEYNTDSLYTYEKDYKTLNFYELLLDKYVLPPSSNNNNKPIEIESKSIKKTQIISSDKKNEFKVFDINAKCNFIDTTSVELFRVLEKLDLKRDGKIISIKGNSELFNFTSDIIDFYIKNDFRVLRVTCSEQNNYKPWGVFEELFRNNFNLPSNLKNFDINKVSNNLLKTFNPLFNLLAGKTIKAMSPEDARFAYMEQWSKFFDFLRNTVIVIENFEEIDDTTIQTLELYFDKFKSIRPNFLFLTTENTSVHSKINKLLRTDLYTEISYNKNSIDSCIETLNCDASDFIKSFYFEKIKENFNGSYLYFKNAIEYLKEAGILIVFEGKLIIQSKKSIILPQSLKELYKLRIKNLSKNPELSFIFAYASILGSRLDYATLKKLGINDLEKNLESLINSKLVYSYEDVLYINNYNLIEQVISNSLKKDAETYLAKNIVSKIGKDLDDTSLAFLMGRLDSYKEEYLTLWKNSQTSILAGDYDAYLKNCLGFLSLIERINTTVPQDAIEENKKEVYNNILLCLYNYSPAKIYYIENLLLIDAINQGDNEKIIKLSNLMLQGALITSNYNDALGLLHNILSRMPNPKLIVNGEVNTKFLLLSLVHIEILYNIGDFKQCVECAQDILAILNADTIEKVKPASFSINLFISHLLETFRLVGFAKLFLLDDDLQLFFENIKKVLNVELPEKDAILAIKDYLAGKVYNSGNVEEYSAFSKIIFLILQEFSILKDDYKSFAQNIYQAKLLASDIHQKEIELFCDLMIAYAYFKIGISEKALAICIDINEQAEKTAMHNILIMTKYFIALLKQESQQEEMMLNINDALAILRKYGNQSQILFALLQQLYIDAVIKYNYSTIDIESENFKLNALRDKLRILLSK